MPPIYQDTIITKYRNLILAAMPGVFKGVYQGDPLRLPKSMLPALIISKSGTRIAPHTNAEDEHEISMILSVVTDIRDEMNDEQQIVPGIAQLYDLIEGRDDQYKLKTKTILNILRTNIEVDAALNLRTDLGSITTSNYGLTVGKRELDSYATEGQVEFVATFNQIR